MARRTEEMPNHTARPSTLDSNVEGPELVFGIVAAVGTPITYFQNLLEKALNDRDYEPKVLHLSDFLKNVELENPLPPADANEFTRIDRLMTLGDELRENTDRGDILALMAAGKINDSRVPGEPLTNSAFILRQLKHPAEVYVLRKIYGDGFHLIGLYCPEPNRRQYLKVHGGISDDQANHLMKRDEEEPLEWGQRFRDTFHLADVFIEVRGGESQDTSGQELDRFLDLLFGSEIVTPTRDEYGMFLAASAAFRSSSLSRQVGAALLSEHSEVISVGCNEVPCYRGGQYWGDQVGEEVDARDHILGSDSTDDMEQRIVEEILQRLDPAWDSLPPEDKDSRIREARKKLVNTTITNLTEFGRAVHAEMEAISAAARLGVSVRGATLYTTTFPCHGCAKHIVVAGIRRVVFIEPYPKSRAIELHKDSIALEGGPREPKVAFEPFVGVAPRRYADLFSVTTKEGKRVRRKDDDGKPVAGALGLRLHTVPYSYLKLEEMAVEVSHRPTAQGGSR